MTYGTNAPNGLVPVSTLSGATQDFALPYMQMQIISGYDQNLGFGSPLAPFASTGCVTIGSPGAATGPGSIPCLGIFNGCVYTNLSNVVNLGAGAAGQAWWAAGTVLATGTTATVNVIGLDPNTLYTVQTNNANGIPLTSNFQNANFVLGNVNSQTGISRTALDQSSLSSVGDATYANLKIWGVDPSSFWSNGFGSAPYNNVIVSINNHFARLGTAGAIAN